jgi:hypothetical protein
MMQILHNHTTSSPTGKGIHDGAFQTSAQPFFCLQLYRRKFAKKSSKKIAAKTKILAATYKYEFQRVLKAGLSDVPDQTARRS